MTKLYLVLVSIIIALSCAKVNHVVNYKVSAYQMDNTLAFDSDEEINKLIDPYKLKIDAEMSEVIGQCAKRLNRAVPESTLGNFVADLIFRKAAEHYEGSIDFAVINYWSIRIEEMQKGNITKGLVYELMPFENYLAIMKVDRNVVLKLFENIAKERGWPVSWQVNFKIAEGKPTDISINGKPLKDNYTYHIAVPDYLANGGSGCLFFEGEDQEIIDVLIRDIIMQGIIDQKNKGEQISADLDGRITLKE